MRGIEAVRMLVLCELASVGCSGSTAQSESARAVGTPSPQPQEPAWRQAQRRDEEQAQADKDAATARQRAAEVDAWAKLDLGKCAGEGDAEACYDVRDFTRKFPASQRVPEAETALAAAAKVQAASAHSENEATSPLRDRVDAANEAGRKRDEDAFKRRPQESSNTGFYCCDGMPISEACGSKGFQKCCAGHHGYCAR